MLTQDDINLLKQVFPTKEDLDQKLAKQKDEILVQVDQKLEKQKKEILQEVDQKLETQKNEIIQAVADTIHDSLIPLFDAHEERIARLEKHVGLTPPPTPGQ